MLVMCVCKRVYAAYKCQSQRTGHTRVGACLVVLSLDDLLKLLMILKFLMLSRMGEDVFLASLAHEAILDDL